MTRSKRAIALDVRDSPPLAAASLFAAEHSARWAALLLDRGCRAWSASGITEGHHRTGRGHSECSPDIVRLLACKMSTAARFIISFALLFAAAAPMAQDRQRIVYVAPIEGIINLGLAPFVKRVLNEATAVSAAAVVLEIQYLRGTGGCCGSDSRRTAQQPCAHDRVGQQARAWGRAPASTQIAYEQAEATADVPTARLPKKRPLRRYLRVLRRARYLEADKNCVTRSFSSPSWGLAARSNPSSVSG